ncbi:unnamed protein product, partial [marine sediment metagenome]
LQNEAATLLVPDYLTIIQSNHPFAQAVDYPFIMGR